VMLKKRMTGKRDIVYTAPVDEFNTDGSEGNVMLHRVVQGTSNVGNIKTHIKDK